ncbi:MAG: hypothetical protein GY909_14290 [Oligoflexia bacterium]|nr:hypothetical protein [Oligoflexia bacterium]
MKKFIIKFLTLQLLFFSAPEIYSVVNHEEAKTHSRISIDADKEAIVVEKKENIVSIKTLNSGLFELMKAKLEGIKLSKKYFSSISYKVPTTKNNVSEIKVTLKDNKVELFSFYKERERKHVLDFWIEADDFKEKLNQKISNTNVKNTSAKKVASKVKAKPKKIPPALVKKDILLPKRNKKAKAKGISKSKKNPGYRDFRYGASFIWDYKGLSPEYKSQVNLNRKTPEYFYPIKDREFKKSEKEAHIQLSINLYRKEKWGLMYKSIKLYGEKYGNDKNTDINEYLKANAILKSNILEGNRDPKKMAINMLSNIADRSTIYEMKKGIYKYLLEFYSQNKQYVEGLKISKRLYVISKDNFDYEESQKVAEVIMYNLAKLNQLEKLNNLMSEKTIKKIVPAQVMLAYKLYTLFSLGKDKELIRTFEAEERGLAKPIHKSILFNVAESYFKVGDFKKSTKYYDQFLTHYSFHPRSVDARVRIALNYEIQERDIKKTIVLYKNAINRSADSKRVFEAKLRYVALRSVRKFNPSTKDKELRVFLNTKENQKIDRNLKKLLWLVRLRTFINDESYRKAISYLDALPLNSMSPSERRVFEGDGSEIVYGLIKKFYQDSQYDQIVKIWNKYNRRYVKKVANDPIMNFIVGQSFIRLGLYDNFEKLYTKFKKLNSTPTRSFPIWVARARMEQKEAILSELSIIKNLKLKNIDLAQKELNRLKITNSRSNKVNYYQGMIKFHQKKYKEAINSLESFLANQKESFLADPAELSEMLQAYTDSLYNLNQTEKFANVAEAILKDVDQFKPSNPFMNSMRERLEYLQMEILAGKANSESFAMLEAKTVSFLKDYKESPYTNRIEYLKGLSLIRNKKVDDGRKIFETLLTKEGVSNYIKELVKAELSLISIRNRTI